MVKTTILQVTAAEAAIWNKVAKIEIDFIRLPFVADDYIKNGLIGICNGAFLVVGYSGVLEARTCGLKQIDWMFWRATIDVYKIEGATPFPWAYIAGAAAGAIFTGTIIYLVRVIPLLEALQEVARDITEVMSEKHQAFEQGKIDKETADRLNAKLEEAKEKAEEAGDDPFKDWVKYLKPIMEMLPMILAFALIATVVGMIPRPRRD